MRGGVWLRRRSVGELYGLFFVADRRWMADHDAKESLSTVHVQSEFHQRNGSGVGGRSVRRRAFGDSLYRWGKGDK